MKHRIGFSGQSCATCGQAVGREFKDHAELWDHIEGTDNAAATGE